MNIVSTVPGISGVLVLAAYSAPMFAVLYYGVDFTSLTTESLAYRYFAVERIQNGEGGNVWLPQGHLLTAIQHLLMLALDFVDHLTPLSFREKLNRFAYLSMAVNVVFVVFLLGLALFRYRFRWSDVVLLGIVLLAPIYAAGTSGFHYHLLPDYLSLSVVLLGFALLATRVSERELHRWGEIRTPVMVGALVGAMIANKVTLAPPAAMMFLAISSDSHKRARPLGFIRYAVATIIAVSLFILGVLLVFYAFRIGAIIAMAPEWWRFVRNPGAEPDFWQRIVEYSRLYFGYGVAFYAVAGLAFVFVTTAGRCWSVHRVLLLVGAILIGAAGGLFIFKRPAQTTFFEVFCMLLFSGAVLVGAIPLPKWREWICALAGVGWALAAATFPVHDAVAMLSTSRALADERWTVFEESAKAAGGERLLILFPSNELHHGGVHELLLKASARFPTWDIDQRGQKLLETFSPNTRFLHEYGGRMNLPSALAEARVVLWFDRVDMPALADRYVELSRLVGGDTADCDNGRYYNSTGEQTHLWWRCKLK